MQKSPLESLRIKTVRVGGVGGLGPHIRGKGPSEGNGPHAAGRGPRAINKTVHVQSKWLIVEKKSVREEFLSRSQSRVRVNKIGPSASGFGTHVKREGSAETKIDHARLAKVRLCRL